MHTIRSVLFMPGLARLYAAQYFIYGQLFLAFTVLPIYTESLGGGPWIVGIHTAMFTGVGLLLRFFLGPLADSHGRKLPLLLGAFVFASAYVLLLFADTLALVGLVRVYQAIGLAAYLSASTALVLDLAPPDQRGLALSLNRSVVALGLLSLPALAEQVIARYGLPTLFVVTAVLTSIGFLLLLTLPSRGGSAGSEWTAPISAIRKLGSLLGGFREVVRRPSVPAILAAVSAVVVAYMASASFLPLRIQSEGGGEFSPFFMAVGLSAFVAGISGSLVDRFGPKVVLLGAVLATGIAGFMLYLTLTLPALLIAGTLLGFGYTLSLSAGPAWIDRLVPHHRRATALALTETALDGGIAIGFPLLGLLISATGYASAFLALSITCGVAIMGIALFSRSPK